MNSPKVLVVGASGYIGGSVLTQLQTSNDATVKSARYSALIRSESQAEALLKQGVTPVMFRGLDDTESVKEIAGQYDVVINMAVSYNTKAAEALIQGLSERKKQTGADVIYIHTSGNSNLADRPLTGTYRETRVFSDTENIHEYQVFRESSDKYDQRTADVAVVEMGLASSVLTYIVQPCNIYGIGSGLFNKLSIPFVAIMKMAIKLGYAPVLGAGNETIDYVHVLDLAELYELLLRKLLVPSEREKLPSGERGIYFCESGSCTWRNVAEGVARAGVKLGVMGTATVTEVHTCEEWVDLVSSTSQILVPSPSIVELGFAGHFKTHAVLGRQLLGWQPKRSEEDFHKHFSEEMSVVLEQQKQKI